MYLDSAYIKDIAAVAKATDKKTQLNAYVLEALRQFFSANTYVMHY